MKKNIALIIVGILVLTGLEAVAISYNNISTNSDELDQAMTSFDGALPLGNTNILGFYANLSAAQSFTPQKEIFTRVQFLMGRNSTTSYPCWLAVRDNLTNENLAIAALEPSNFPVVNGTPTQEQLAWVEFDFKDIKITSGNTYYLALYTLNITENYYWISGNGTNIYPNGTVYLSIDDGASWSEFTDADACFKTYGRSNQAPSVPSINGKIKGKANRSYIYAFVASDPDGDDLFYYIDWGDTLNVSIGPYASGAEGKANHSWLKGTYTIKAKAMDIFGAESNWTTLEVTMPRNRAIDNPILRLLENHPLLFKIFQLFLQF